MSLSYKVDEGAKRPSGGGCGSLVSPSHTHHGVFTLRELKVSDLYIILINCWNIAYPKINRKKKHLQNMRLLQVGDDRRGSEATEPGWGALVKGPPPHTHTHTHTLGGTAFGKFT